MPTPEQIDKLMLGFAIGFPSYYLLLVGLGS